MDILIRRPTESDAASWRDLWEAYLAFYETELPRGHSENLWQRILDSENGIQCHLAEVNDEVVGLVHFFAHEDTWSAVPICYLQDLYVEKGMRGSGIGRTLVESVVEVATENGWPSVYWLTAEDNLEARFLYDSLTGGTSGFIHYEIASRD